MKESLRITDEGVHILQKMKMKNMEAPLDAEANVERGWSFCELANPEAEAYYERAFLHDMEVLGQSVEKRKEIDLKSVLDRVATFLEDWKKHCSQIISSGEAHHSIDQRRLAVPHLIFSKFDSAVLGKAAKAGYGRAVVLFLKRLPLFEVESLVEQKHYSTLHFPQNGFDPLRTSISGVLCRGSAHGLSLNRCDENEDTSRLPKVPIWQELSARSQGVQQVAAHLVPLPSLCTFDTLQLLERHCSVELYESTLMRAVVSALWHRLRKFICILTAQYLALLVLFTGFAISCVGGGLPYSSQLSDMDSQQHIFCACIPLVIVLNCAFLVREGTYFALAPLDYIAEPWNCLQLTTHVLVVASISTYMTGVDSSVQRVVSSFALLFVYLGFIYFLKAIKQISFLVEVLVQVLFDMLPFMLILFIIAVGVTLGINVLVRTLNDDGNSSSYGQFSSALFRVMRIAEGRLDYEVPVYPDGLDAGLLSFMFHFLFVFLLFIVTVMPLPFKIKFKISLWPGGEMGGYILQVCSFQVVSLNLLVALMTNTYERVMEKKVPEQYRQWLKVCLDVLLVWKIFDEISWLLVRGLKLIVGIPTSVEKVLLSTKIERLEKSMRFIHVLSPSSNRRTPDSGYELWEGNAANDWYGQLELIEKEFNAKFQNLEDKFTILGTKIDSNHKALMDQMTMLCSERLCS